MMIANTWTRKRLAIACCGALLIGLAFTSWSRAQAVGSDAKQFSAWGDETLAMIRRDLWLEDQQLFADRARLNRPPRQPAFMWGAGVQLSALAMAAQVDEERYLPALTHYADALDVYWVEHQGIGGYDVLPDQKNPDRYYDDNVWIVLALVETHSVTGEAKYLDRAKATMRFVLSGEDEKLGGGIYWRENTRDSKNTCSNAPTVVGCLLLHNATGNAEYLTIAERLYIWTQEQLQDDRDGLYLDNVNLEGEVDRRKFTYNTALMIRANCVLYAATGKSKYLLEAEMLAESAAHHWADKNTGAIRDGGRFAHMLLEAFLAVDEATNKSRWRDLVEKSVTYVYEQLRDSRGHYGSRWDRPPTQPWRRFELLDQASAARAFFVAADRAKESNANSRAD